MDGTPTISIRGAMAISRPTIDAYADGIDAYGPMCVVIANVPPSISSNAMPDALAVTGGLGWTTRPASNRSRLGSVIPG